MKFRSHTRIPQSKKVLIHHVLGIPGSWGHLGSSAGFLQEAEPETNALSYQKVKSLEG